MERRQLAHDDKLLVREIYMECAEFTGRKVLQVETSSG